MIPVGPPRCILAAMSISRLLSYAAVCGACSAACDLPQNLGDLGGSLLDPDTELLEIPGRQLASGHYSRLELDGSLESGGWIVAKRHDLDSEAVSVISFTGDGQCDITDATDFQRVSSRVDVALPGLIAVQRPSGPDRGPTVEFVGFDCEPRLDPVEASSLPSVPFPRSTPRGLLMLTSEGHLLLVDATRQTLEPIATNVRSGSSEGNRLWLLRGEGETSDLVVYDSALEELATWPDVAEHAVLGGWSEPNAAVRDAEGLHFVTVATGEKELIAEDGCQAVPLGNQVLAYYAPCAERRLQLSIPGHLIEREEDRVTVEIGPDVTAPSEVILNWQGKDSFALYQVNPASGTAPTGELRLAERLGYDPEEREDRSVLPEARLSRSQVYVDWDGVSGTLMAPRYTTREGRSVFEGLDPVAAGVAQLAGGDVTSERGVLIDYDGETGALVRFTRSGDGEFDHVPIAEGVPIQTQVVDPGGAGFALVGDFAGRGGTAYLVQGGAARAVGESALPNTLRFLEDPPALAYLAHDGSGATATLRAWLLEAELNVRVADQVSEYRELPWPSAGLLYAVPEGDRAGVWFARAR